MASGKKFITLFGVSTYMLNNDRIIETTLVYTFIFNKKKHALHQRQRLAECVIANACVTSSRNYRTFHKLNYSVSIHRQTKRNMISLVINKNLFISKTATANK